MTKIYTKETLEYSCSFFLGKEVFDTLKKTNSTLPEILKLAVVEAFLRQDTDNDSDQEKKHSDVLRLALSDLQKSGSFNFHTAFF